MCQALCKFNNPFKTQEHLKSICFGLLQAWPSSYILSWQIHFHLSGIQVKCGAHFLSSLDHTDHFNPVTEHESSSLCATLLRAQPDLWCLTRTLKAKPGVASKPSSQVLTRMETDALDLSLMSMASSVEATPGLCAAWTDFQVHSRYDGHLPGGLVSLVLSCETNAVLWTSQELTELLSSL